MEWTGARYADKPTVEAHVHIDAPPEEVWELVSDPVLMAELSGELQAVEWVDGVPAPEVGGRFVGRNSHPALGEWSTTSYIVEYDRPHRFTWAVEDPLQPTATWRFTLTPEDEGTELCEWMQCGPARSGLNIAIDAMPDKEEKIIFVRLREHEANMIRVLEQIKARVEGASST